MSNRYIVFLILTTMICSIVFSVCFYVGYTYGYGEALKNLQQSTQIVKVKFEWLK